MATAILTLAARWAGEKLQDRRVAKEPDRTWSRRRASWRAAPPLSPSSAAGGGSPCTWGSRNGRLSGWSTRLNYHEPLAFRSRNSPVTHSTPAKRKALYRDQLKQNPTEIK